MDLRQCADQRIRIVRQLDRAEIARGFLRLPGRLAAREHQDHHGDERETHEHAGVGTGGELQRGHRGNQQRDDDEPPAARKETHTVEVLVVRDLVREDRRRLAGFECVEQGVAHRDGRLVQGAQRDRVRDAATLRAVPVDRRASLQPIAGTIEHGVQRGEERRMRGVGLERRRAVQREPDRREPAMPDEDDDRAECAERECELVGGAGRARHPDTHVPRDQHRRQEREQPQTDAGDEAGGAIRDVLRKRPLVAVHGASDRILGDEQAEECENDDGEARVGERARDDGDECDLRHSAPASLEQLGERRIVERAEDRPPRPPGVGRRSGGDEGDEEQLETHDWGTIATGRAARRARSAVGLFSPPSGIV